MRVYNDVYRKNIIPIKFSNCNNLIIKLNCFSKFKKDKYYTKKLKILLRQEEEHYVSFLDKPIKQKRQKYYRLILYTLTKTLNPPKLKEKNCSYDEKGNMFIATCRCVNESKKNYLLKKYSKDKPKSYNERIESCNKK